MDCPYCGHEKSRVIDTQKCHDAVMRQRMCLKCGRRFFTTETCDSAGVAETPSAGGFAILIRE